MVSAVTTAVFCPACGRRITEAEEIKGQRLRCKSCSAQLIIDLMGGVLSVRAVVS